MFLSVQLSPEGQGLTTALQPVSAASEVKWVVNVQPASKDSFNSNICASAVDREGPGLNPGIFLYCHRKIT